MEHIDASQFKNRFVSVILGLIDEAMAARELEKQQYLSRSAGQQPGSSKLSPLGSRQEVGEMQRTDAVDRPN
jgi:hypothetical protein